ncbi:MAG: helix-turn-helix domain-containing protein [Candidatus Acidiferrum sp.]
MTKSQKSLVSNLGKRRRARGMSLEALVKRSGVSRATVRRILLGNHVKASWSNVVAVAEALGLQFTIEPAVEDQKFKEQEAERKARRLVGMVQSTMALEAQAVSGETIEKMVGQTVQDLMAGSERRLWSQ